MKLGNKLATSFVVRVLMVLKIGIKFLSNIVTNEFKGMTTQIRVLIIR